MLTFALRWAWSFLSPWLGPALVTVAPWLSWLPGVSWRSVLRGVALAGLLGFVAWGTWRLVRPDPDAPPMVAVSIVEAQRYKAENDSLRAALEKARETLRARDQESEVADQYIEALKAEKEALRALSSNPDAPVFAADDPWLLGGRR